MRGGKKQTPKVLKNINEKTHLYFFNLRLCKFMSSMWGTIVTHLNILFLPHPLLVQEVQLDQEDQHRPMKIDKNKKIYMLKYKHTVDNIPIIDYVHVFYHTHT